MEIVEGFSVTITETEKTGVTKKKKSKIRKTLLYMQIETDDAVIVFYIFYFDHAAAACLT